MSKAVITENVEDTLLETINVCRKVNLPLRALYLKFGVLASKPQDWQARLFPVLVAALDGLEAMTYSCADGDVFIISRALTQKMVLRVLGDLPKDLVPALEEEGLARLFELPQEAPDLQEIVQQKINEQRHKALSKIEEENQRRLVEHTAMQKKVEVDIVIGAGLISSISSRRMERKRPGVLMIEDDVFSLHLVGNALRTEYDFNVASNARDGLNAYIKYAPDILFLDINLPGLSGLEILKEILSIDPNAFVVMLSGNGNKDNVMGAVTGGAKGFVGKPFTLDKLKDYISKSPHFHQKRQKWETTHAG